MLVCRHVHRIISVAGRSLLRLIPICRMLQMSSLPTVVMSVAVITTSICKLLYQCLFAITYSLPLHFSITMYEQVSILFFTVYQCCVLCEFTPCICVHDATQNNSRGGPIDDRRKVRDEHRKPPVGEYRQPPPPPPPKFASQHPRDDPMQSEEHRHGPSMGRHVPPPRDDQQRGASPLYRGGVDV